MGNAQAAGRYLHPSPPADVAVRGHDHPTGLGGAARLRATPSLRDVVLGRKLTSQRTEVAALLPEVTCRCAVVPAEGAFALLLVSALP